jgi:hypothetical protein
MPKASPQTGRWITGWALAAFWLLQAPTISVAQYQAAPITVSEQVAVQMIQAWARSLSRNDVEGLAAYYADPRYVTPWKERIQARRIQNASVVAIHGIRPAPEKSWNGVPLSGEVRFTIQFVIEGYGQPVNETRVWGLTNRNGFLQIASEIREKDPDIVAGQSTPSPFPQFGSDPVPAPPPQPAPPQAPVLPPMETGAAPAPPTEPVSSEPAPSTLSTVRPSLSEDPIEKAELIKQLWETLLVRYKKAYSMKSEQLYLRLFVSPPKQALKEFRERLQRSGWMQIENLAIDEDSVRGNKLNATFTFRYSPWGAGLKRGDMIMVDCAATRGGPGMSYGWRFTKFGDEILSASPKPPGYYPTQAIINSAVTPRSQTPQQPQRQQPWMMPGFQQPQQQGMGFGMFGRRY